MNNKTACSDLVSCLVGLDRCYAPGPVPLASMGLKKKLGLTPPSKGQALIRARVTYGSLVLVPN